MINIFDQLKLLNLTDNGRYLLKTIPNSILFKAKRDFDRIVRFVPCYKIQTFYALCLRFCEMQKSYPDWRLADGFLIEQTISKNNEIFCMRLVIKIEKHLEQHTKDLSGLRDKLCLLLPDGTLPDPLKPLKDAIATERINITGLKFLRGCFIKTKPKVVHEINKYIYSVESKMVEKIKNEVDGDEQQQELCSVAIDSVL